MIAPQTDEEAGGDSAGMIAIVAVDGVDRTAGEHGLLSYALPTRSGGVRRGSIVWVPLRRGFTRGVVVDVERPRTPVGPFDLRPIHGLVQPPVVLDERRLEVGLWLARETVTSPFAALEPFLPARYGKDVIQGYRRTTGHGGDTSSTPAQRGVLEILSDGQVWSLPDLQKATGRKLTSVLRDLLTAELIEQVPLQPSITTGERTERIARLAVPPDVAVRAAETLRSERQRALLDALVAWTQDLVASDDPYAAVSSLARSAGVPAATVASLEAQGLVETIARPRLPSNGMTGLRSDSAPTLTGAQEAAWDNVRSALDARDSTPRLLQGVTGSGKTEIYLAAVDRTIRSGRGAIVLVPEITLATQVVRRFRARFPGQVAVLHSSLALGERLAAWNALARGDIRVVVGARSALFAPLPDIGLIVLDEEHEGAYKQDTDPRYHARELALELARRFGAAVILGSATPSVESTWRADQGEAVRLLLPARIRPGAEVGGPSTELDLPTVEIADLRLELHRGNSGVLSQLLKEMVRQSLDRGEQAILLLNRRGMATVVLCQECGHRLICPHCDIPLVFHQDRGLLICHRCDYRLRPPPSCPVCGGSLTYFGAGTQRVEAEVAAIFPDARVLRWDQDTARRRGAPEAMLKAVEQRDVDLVVGTQMIAKGLDFPYVTTVGVINADSMLHLPDFRSAERTFQLLTQVAGRAGRREQGRVVVQTYTPQHYAIQAAAAHDYTSFYEEEIRFRDENFYPPFSRLVRFAFRHRNEAACMEESEIYSRILIQHVREQQQVGVADILGPTPAFAARVRDEYQWQIVLRSPEMEALLATLPTRPGWVIDVDPLNLL